MKHFFLPTQKKKQIIDITDVIDEFLEQEEIDGSVCFLFIKHTTAALTTADLDPGTDLDMLDAFEELLPKLPYRHPHNPKHVSDHINASLIGPSLTIPIVNGQLDLGMWQRVIVIELDGPRQRELTLQVL